MNSILRYLLIAAMQVALFVPNTIAQSFTTNDYKKALWMTARMYGGQRSGDGPNWLIMDHTPSNADMATLASGKNADLNQLQPGKCFTKDADGSYSLSGGWVDCGDHVKFGQTMFYSAYILLKAYAEFPHGYDDFYSPDYSGYQASGDFSWEGGTGVPNGIPDILDEVKYETDFLIKCARNSTTFYSQVGDGGADHMNWVTSVAMATLPKSQGGQADGAREFVKNPNDASMPSFCAATLALMSRVYEKFDPDYAATCLTHAKYAYDYASSKKGSTESAGGYYPANKMWEDDYICASAELYWKTGEASYKTAALALNTELGNHNYCFNYNNNQDIAAYNLAKLGDTDAIDMMKMYVDSYIGKTNTTGLYTGGDAGWGPLRYNANAAFIVAMWGALNESATVDQFIYDNVNYILGGNSSNFSFVVGYERENCGSCSYAKHPHHRNVYLIDDIMADQNSMSIPTRNIQHGYLIGGSRSVPFTEVATAYETSEGGIDYNAGLVGAIGYIVSRLSPVDTNKFGHPAPILGEEKTLCGTGSATINIGMQAINNVSIKWLRDDIELSNLADQPEIVVSEAGIYTCEFDSVGEWQTSGSVIVSDILPTVELGDDISLCDPAFDTIGTTINGEGITYSWTKDGSALEETSSSLVVYTAGEYELTLSATGCTSQSDAVTVSSMLPSVSHDTICQAGTVTLKVNEAGSYEWFDQAEDGLSLSTDNPFAVSVSESSVFYVQDANSFVGSVGPTSAVSEGTDWGVNETNHLVFTVERDFQITSMKVMLGNMYGDDAAGTISIEILDANGNSLSPAQTFTSDPTNITTSMANTLVEFPFTNLNVKKSWGTELRMKLSDKSYNGGIIFDQSGASYPYESSPAGVATITGANQNGTVSTSAYMYFYDWTIIAGSSCARTPVLAVVDPEYTDCGSTTTVTQSVQLSSGWNLIGIGVGMTDYSIETLLGGNLDNVVSIKNGDGFYMPDRANYLNSINELKAGEAYFIKVSNPFTFQLTGTALENFTRDVSTGWNLVAFPYETNTATDVALQSVWSNFSAMKNFAQFYIKNNGKNNLNTVSIGNGYVVKMSADDTIEY